MSPFTFAAAVAWIYETILGLWPRPDQSVKYLILFHSDRGVGSGFTGRENQWTSAFDAIADDPWGVGYKRSERTFAGHNGFLKLIVEFGVVGGGILIGAILWLVGQAVVNAYSLSGEDPLLRRFASARAAGLVALAVAAFFQPQLFNVGDAVGISIVLLLFGPDTIFRVTARINTRIAKPGRTGAYTSLQPKSQSSLPSSPTDRAGI
jgi:O-antigen ligase